MAIIEAIRAGAATGAAVTVVPDRAEAIVVAVDLARPGDVVLVAGKGHEDTQTAGGVSVPFDDRVEAGRALAVRFGGPVGRARGGAS